MIFVINIVGFHGSSFAAGREERKKEKGGGIEGEEEREGTEGREEGMEGKGPPQGVSGGGSLTPALVLIML